MHDTELNCAFNGHNKSNLKGICINKSCDKQRHACLICTNEFHKQHVDDVLDFNEFIQWREEGLQFEEQITSIMKELEQSASLLGQLIPLNSIESKLNLLSATTVQVNSEVERVLLLKSWSQLLLQDLSRLSEQLQQIQRKCKLCQSENKEEVQHLKQRVKFQFSQQYKQEDLYVQQQGNVVKCPQDYWGYCICEPTIPNNGVTRVAFKILKCCRIYIGVCQRDFIQSANYDPSLSKIRHGSYLISNCGYSYSHDNQEINGNQQSFEFDTSNIIIVEVDMVKKKISWRKKQSIEIFTMQLNLQEELSYCVRLYGSCGDQLVEVMNGI